MQGSTRAFIHDIETVVPENAYSQEFALGIMKRLYRDDRKILRFLDRVYPATAIDTRYSIISDYKKDPADHSFYPKNAELLPEPTTKERNALFASASNELSFRAASRLLDRNPGVKDEVTHLITISCTGFTAPGFDYHLIKSLDLPSGVHRFHLGFMGCYAAFTGMKLAADLVRANPNARVLMVNVELCSVHMQQKKDLDTVVANAIFADGVSAALISGDSELSAGPKIELSSFVSRLLPDSENEMAWDIGQNGFEMKLSSYVPRLVEENIGEVLDDAIGRSGLSRSDVDIWAIHPGGRAILDKTAETLGVDPAAFEVSYEVLRNYGNMSSATIMFVLDRIMRDGRSGNVFAAAFGPGLTLEAAHMQKVASREPLEAGVG